MSVLISALCAQEAEAGVGGLQSVLMGKSTSLEASKGAQQTFAQSSPCFPAAGYKLLFSYPPRLHLQTWYLFARCTVCFRFLLLTVISCINLECPRSVLDQNLSCARAH